MLTSTALFALAAWMPLVILLFVLIPQRRAVVAAYVLGWLFLPQAAIPVPGVLPDYGRSSAIGGGILVATLLLDFKRFGSIKPHWLDLPIAAYCLAPLLASLSNGLGVYDGLGQSMNTTIRWGVPYVVARLYFGDASGVKLLAMGIVAGGLLYIPFCLYEARMSPNLHHTVYGFSQHSFLMTRRLGGWRPQVFMAHGLEVGLFMASATLVAGWLWVSGTVRRYEGLSALVLGLLLLTAILTRSSGAILLLFAGGAALLCGGWFGWRLPLLLLAILPATYSVARCTGAWTGELPVSMVQRVNPDRAQSLAFRLNNEDLLIERALRRPVLGWGGWGRNRLVKKRGEDASITTDGLWVIALGMHGVFGLTALLLAYLLPVAVFLYLVPTKLWGSPALASVTALAALLSIGMIDNLLNAMFTPFAPLAMGALVGLWSRLLRLRTALSLADLEAAAAGAPGTDDPRPGIAATADAAP